MPDSPYVSLYDAGQVRTAQLGAALLALEADECATAATEQSILDLLGGLEQVARQAEGAPQLAIRGYLIETYGLEQVGLDPFDRPTRPPLSAGGNLLKRRPLLVNGKALRVNGKILCLGAYLVPYPSV